MTKSLLRSELRIKIPIEFKKLLLNEYLHKYDILDPWQNTNTIQGRRSILNGQLYGSLATPLQATRKNHEKLTETLTNFNLLSKPVSTVLMQLNICDLYTH